MTVRLQELHLKGTPVAPGIAIGEPYYVDMPDDPIPDFSVTEGRIENEIKRYLEAVQKGKSEILRLQAELNGDEGAEGAAILEAHLLMLEDPVMIKEVETGIRQSNKNAEFVFHKVMKKYQQKFNALKDPYFLDRLKDIRDVSRRVQNCLRCDYRSNFLHVPDGAIIFIRDLSPTDVVEASSLGVVAFVTQSGGIASHAAIICKAKGIPMLTSVDFNRIEHPFNSVAIVDGMQGDLYINPAPQTLEEFRNRKSVAQERHKEIYSMASLKAETYDGYAVRLSANISMMDELELLQSHGDFSVGLFRSEYVFLSNEDFPSEDKQFETYARIVKEMKGQSIVIRVFDLGGDKYMLNQKAPFESNPFLGCRAIRFLLRERHLFKAQLKAILRASVFGEVGIMFPMISTMDELLEAKDILRESQLELQIFDHIETKTPRIGCMIEVPSAALIADLLAKECDFLSLGTNDLVQYCLAVDRGNQALSSLYTSAHPGVIRLIKHVVQSADQQGIPVSVCGEVAGDPQYTALLLGLGIRELSVSLCNLAEIKAVIRNTSIVEAVQLADRALLSSTASEVEAMLSQALREQ